MAFALIAAAATMLAPPAATWHVTGAPGAVTAVTAHVKDGGRIVADRFVSDPGRVADERAAFHGTNSPHDSCASAAAARPFTRLRRYAANGRLLWDWHVALESQALRVQAVGAGDCLSPDGQRLTVAIYRFVRGEPVERLGEGVVAVDRHPRFVEFRGQRSRRIYGGSHDTALIGWRRGRPATLMFEIDSADAAVISDEAVASESYARSRGAAPSGWYDGRQFVLTPKSRSSPTAKNIPCPTDPDMR